MPYKDPLKAKEHQKQYYFKNKDKLTQEAREKYLTHKSEINSRNNEWYKKNAESVKKKRKDYYMKHKDKIYNRSKAWKQNHVEATKKYMRGYSVFRRQKNYQWFLSFMGVDSLFCSRCHYNKSATAIQIHHMNPRQKESRLDTFGVWLNLPTEKFQNKIKEIEISVLCANCHAELHAGLWEYGE